MEAFCKMAEEQEPIRVALQAFYQHQQMKQMQQQQQIQESVGLLASQYSVESTEASFMQTSVSNEQQDEVGEHHPEVEAQLSADDDFDELLISEVRPFKCLWDTKCRGYRETPKKIEAWKVISRRIGKHEDQLKKRWKNLRDAMMKCLKKIDVATRSGAAASKTPTCKYFDQLLFIRDTVSNRPTESNIQIQEEITEFDVSSLSSPPESPYTTPAGPAKNTCDTPKFGKPYKKMRLDKSKQNEELAERRDTIDLLLAEALTTPKEGGCDDDNSDLLFCKSLVKTLQRLPARKNILAKIEIQQVLLKHEFDE